MGGNWERKLALCVFWPSFGKRHFFYIQKFLRPLPGKRKEKLGDPLKSYISFFVNKQLSWPLLGTGEWEENFKRAFPNKTKKSRRTRDSLYYPGLKVLPFSASFLLGFHVLKNKEFTRCSEYIRCLFLNTATNHWPLLSCSQPGHLVSYHRFTAFFEKLFVQLFLLNVAFSFIVHSLSYCSFRPKQTNPGLLKTNRQFVMIFWFVDSHCFFFFCND